jgi:hypothetical protein
MRLSPLGSAAVSAGLSRPRSDALPERAKALREAFFWQLYVSPGGYFERHKLLRTFPAGARLPVSHTAVRESMPSAAAASPLPRADARAEGEVFPLRSATAGFGRLEHPSTVNTYHCAQFIHTQYRETP